MPVVVIIVRAKALTCAVALALWLQVIVLAPLGHEARAMNLQQLDPTEIVQIPTSLHRLTIFTLGIVFLSVITCSHMLARLWLLAQGTIMLCLTMIVAGAPPTENMTHSILAALVGVALATWDVPLYVNSVVEAGVLTATTRPPPSWALLMQRWRATSRNGDKCQNEQRANQERFATIVLHTIVACTIPCQVLRLYDRGWQWQRWPLPVVLGCSFGWMVGTVLGSVIVAPSTMQAAVPRRND